MMNKPLMGIALVAVFLASMAVVVGIAALAMGEKAPAKAETHWIYGQRTTASTGQPGVIVYCQDKTNSLPFAQRKHATPGDVYVMTCRAVRAPEAS